jgi:hypothetical protein
MTRRVALSIGETYFSLFFMDEALRLPVVETLVYLGPDLIEVEGGSAPGHLFQYASSYHSDGNWNDMTDEEREQFEEPPVIAYEEAHLDPVVDADGLVEELRNWQGRMA